MKIRTAVFVSGGGTNLQALIDAQASGLIRSAELTLVVSNRRDAYALERARAANIESVVVSRKKAGSQQAFEQAIVRELEARGIELIVLAGFMCILSADFTRRYENRILNVHPSLIPSYCGKGFYGLKVHEAALAYGVNEVPDGGRIILQKAVEIEEGDTPETLQRRVMEQAEWKLLPAAVEKVSSDLLKGEQHA